MSVYEQIAHNKRLAVVYVLIFVLLWLGIGALVGWIFAAVSAASIGSPSVTTDVIAGAGFAGLLALAATAFALTSGARLILAVSGAQPADPTQYRQLHDIVEALAVGDGLPTKCPPVRGGVSGNPGRRSHLPERR
jgi:Zn-dependent protease with chaperone function